MHNNRINSDHKKLRDATLFVSGYALRYEGKDHMSEEEQYVECCTHGKQQATYVCQHIVQSLHDGIPRGFWSAEPEPGDLRPDSWCNACEEKVNSSGGEWNDESEEFAGVTLLCGVCYDRAKAMNKDN